MQNQFNFPSFKLIYCLATEDELFNLKLFCLKKSDIFGLPWLQWVDYRNQKKGRAWQLRDLALTEISLYNERAGVARGTALLTVKRSITDFFWFNDLTLVNLIREELRTA